MQMDLPEIEILSPGAARAFKAIDFALVGLACFCLMFFFWQAMRDNYIDATAALILGVVLGMARDELRDHVIRSSKLWVERRCMDREDGYACGYQDALRDKAPKTYALFSGDQGAAVAAMSAHDDEFLRQSDAELAENGL